MPYRKRRKACSRRRFRGGYEGRAHKWRSRNHNIRHRNMVKKQMNGFGIRVFMPRREFSSNIYIVTHSESGSAFIFSVILNEAVKGVERCKFPPHTFLEVVVKGIFQRAALQPELRRSPSRRRESENMSKKHCLKREDFLKLMILLPQKNIQ